MMYLVDTNVVSELRRPHVQRGRSAAVNPQVLAWSKSVALASQFLSVVTILELEYGALLMLHRDARQGAVLRRWLDKKVLPAFAGRVLLVDTTVALQCAALQVPDPRPDRDALIAATALVHGMTVVTRNVAHFKPTGVALLNPWED
jgi:predicted nucleic acid-binding protein